MYITANGHIKINVGDDNLCMSGANNSFYPKTIGRAVIITVYGFRQQPMIGLTQCVYDFIIMM